MRSSSSGKSANGLGADSATECAVIDLVRSLVLLVFEEQEILNVFFKITFLSDSQIVGPKGKGLPYSGITITTPLGLPKATFTENLTTSLSNMVKQAYSSDMISDT